MFKPRHTKKTDTLEVRMPHDTKRAFIEAARAEGRTASDVVRDAIDDYLRRAARRRSSVSDRSIAMILNTPEARRSALAATAAAIGLAAVAVTPSTAEIDLRAAFERLDTDGDGRVSFEEYSVSHGGAGVMIVASEHTIDEGDGPVSESSEYWIPAGSHVGVDEPVHAEERSVHVTRRINEDGTTSEEVEIVDEDVDVEALLADLAEHQFGQFDKNGDGAVDLAEFEARHAEMFAATFSVLDTDGDGRLEAEEFAALPTALAGSDLDEPLSLPAPLSADGFARFDRDGDGAMSLEEFSAGPAAD